MCRVSGQCAVTVSPSSERLCVSRVSERGARRGRSDSVGGALRESEQRARVPRSRFVFNCFARILNARDHTFKIGFPGHSRAAGAIVHTFNIAR